MKKLTILILTIIILPIMAFATATSEQEPPKVKTIENPVIKKNHSDYKFIVRVEPHWILIDEINTSFQFKFGGNFSIGPILAYMSGGSGVYSSGSVSGFIFDDYETIRIKYGVRSTYFFSGNNESSAYINAVVTRADNKVEGTGFLGSGKETGKFSETMLGITGGYQWQWNRFNLNVGGGLGSYITPDNFTLTAANGSQTTRDLDFGNNALLIDIGLGLSF